jgi:hypothetical protein
MNKTDIRRIIKEEISRAITENKPKFKQGEHFKYMGTDHEVIDDNGFIVTAITKNGNRVKLNHNQLKAINESDFTTKLPTPGTYNIVFTTERRSSWDEIELDVTESDIEGARRKGSNGYNFWRDIIEPYAPFFTSQDRISTVKKVDEPLNEYGVETKQGVYTTSTGKTYPKYRDGERLCIKVRGKKIEIENAAGKKRNTQDIERDIRLADIH